MTRVLHVIASADPESGGPVEGARQIGAAWSRHGHVQDWATMDDPATTLGSMPGGVVHALGRLRAGRRYGLSPALVRWLSAYAADYDAVLVAGLWNFATMAARLALPGGRVPWFVFTHGMLDPYFKRGRPLSAAVKQLSWLACEGPLLHGARQVFFTTDDERRLARGVFRPYRVTGQVVGYGTADVPAAPPGCGAPFEAALPQLGDAPFLLFLGRVHPKKGCDLLIEGFTAIAARRPDLHLVIAGPDQAGLLAGLRAQAERSGVGARVHFPGMLTGDAKLAALHRCEAFALISHQENFGVAVTEAMACGKPVLITDKVNIYHEVAAAGAGLVGTDTGAGAADLLGRYAGWTPTERDRAGRAARDAFLSHYEIEQVATQLMRAIERGIATGPAPPR